MLIKTVAILSLAAAPLLPAQTLTQHERDFAMSHLHATRKMFLDSITGLTPEQWTFKAGPDRWSIAECAEHIATSEDFMFGLVTNQLMKSPADPTKRAEVKGKDEAIVKQVPERSQKFKAPDVIAPKNRWSTPDAIISHFKEAR